MLKTTRDPSFGAATRGITKAESKKLYKSVWFRRKAGTYGILPDHVRIVEKELNKDAATKGMVKFE